MAQKHLTATWLSKVPKAEMPEKGKRKDYSDTTPNLYARVNDKGEVLFHFIARFGKKDPERRTLGPFDEKASELEARLRAEGHALPRPPVAMSLARARELAEEWAALVKMRIDPREHEARLAAAAAARSENSFEAVVEEYLKDIKTRDRNRHVDQDEREIRRELLQRVDKKTGKVVWRNAWAKKPVAAVTDKDIADLIAEIRDRPAAGMAYNTLGHVKAIFAWAMWPERRHGYDLKGNPIAHLQPKHFKLSKTVSKRVLTDDEIRAYWAAADATPYPLGAFYKLLMLTGQRKAEVSDMERPEISHNRKLWTVPEERFKSGQSHIVPLSDDAIALIGKLPTFDGEDSGDFLFSTTNGKKPINGFSRAKAALDEAMLAELKKLDPKAKLPEWVFHDVRRTVRTRLSGLRINSDVAELVIGHGKTGLRRVYDQHEFESEMREALDRWAAELKRIVSPMPPENVISIDRKTA
ncbi:site-specific integrase [Rhizobium leguminosarum]|uniref:tyrosine-type recombinase/integrase n=1 Tax=Rhizobium leguminosarum TaxID=384 RepID=UPI001C908DFD|nr:tyrosine-type recombinase/integrase [Rhizobium leguminosarum]MBY3054473.1 site-specific integrase [Rhizobium leguminosarum]